MTMQLQASGSQDDNLDIEIGRRVHQLMWDQHLTQTVFAERVGMDQSSVAKRLRGRLTWNARQIKRAADALGTTVAYLFGEVDDPSPEPGPRSSD